MKRRISILLFLLIMLISCSDKVTESNGNSIVSGTVYYNSEPIINATIRLSNANRYETTLFTNEYGYFEFQNVPNDVYELSYTKTFENGCFVERSNDINVVENCNFDNLLLPDAVSMYEPTNVTYESFNLSWSPTNVPDFREYKLFRGLTSGLDEATGLLIHASTAMNDTTFTDEDIVPFESYYYRVYVMNDYGRLGGSNIVSAQTEIENIIPDGEFEYISSINNYWNILRGSGSGYYTEIVDSISIEGQSSLYNINPKSYSNGAVNTFTIMKSNTPIYLVPNTTYELSCWMKAEGEITDIGGLVVSVKQGDNCLTFVRIDTESFGSMGDPISIEWTYKNSSFFTTSTEAIEIQIYITNEHFWIDNLSLSPLNQ